MTTPILETRQLEKSYLAGKVAVHALRGVTFSVLGGEFLSIMGPSGCGKSTLLHLVGGVDTPSSGTILLEQRDIGTLSDRERSLVRRRRLGFIFQRMNLLPSLTAWENVALPLRIDSVTRSEARRRALEALARVHLAERSEHLPQEMSGGEQQRVAIARALVVRPALILADEPTGALDSRNGRDVVALLRDCVEQGQTVIMVTHDVGVARQTDRLLVMRDGELVESVTSEQLRHYAIP